MSDGLPARLLLRAVTPRRLLVEAEVEAVFLPTLEGEIGVLPGHRPLFVALGRGRLAWRAGAEEEAVAVAGGWAQVEPERVVVMTEAGGDDASG